MKVTVENNDEIAYTSLLDIYDILTTQEACDIIIQALDDAIEKKLNNITINDFISETSLNKEDTETN
jgi:hypothetical protein